jgi:DeoR/GlpR family transcriptional regulator of sugar metabolism
MAKEDRQKIILREVRLHNRVLLNDLAVLLEVSPDTVRRDIIELDTKQKILRVHGGAQAISYQPYNYNAHEIYFHDEKMKIAAKAVSLVEEGSISLISGGTTNLELARILPDDLQATFFTPSLPIAMQLLEHAGIEVIFLGGRLSRNSQIALGGNVLNTLANIKFDNCFLGTSYLDPDHGLTEFDWEVVQLKKAMISAARKIISLTISEKFGSTQRYKVCNIESINILVTELDTRDEKLKQFHNRGVDIL